MCYEGEVCDCSGGRCICLDPSTRCGEGEIFCLDCFEGDCCVGTDCDAGEACINNTCSAIEQECDDCQLDIECLRRIIADGGATQSLFYEFSSINLGDFGDITNALDVVGNHNCNTVVANCVEDDCENCIFLVRDWQYNFYTCIDGSCYNVVLYLPLYYQSGSTYWHKTSTFIFNSIICDSKTNSNVYTDDDMKCHSTSESDCIQQTVTQTSCQRQDGVDNSNLTGVYRVFPSTSNTCPINCGGTTTPDC